MQLICIILLLAVLAVYGVFQFLNAGKYKDFFLPLDNKEYSYKALLPGCLGIAEALGLSGDNRYQAMLSQKIVMLHGSRYVAYYSKVHWSVKIFYMILGLILSSLFCIFGDADYTALAVIPGAGLLLFFLADKILDDRYKERKFKLERDFPDFLSKLVLLINAGLNVRQAIERIVTEAPKDAPLYSELLDVLTDIRAGVSENEAFSDFAERCKIKQITNFVSILQQNMKLGGSQMLFELRRMGTECWELRKNVAKQLGETASSKLMIPLVLMLLAVILICVAPVIIEFRSVF
jgi:tight adherence protein C